jgi:hypothetical protein
MYCPKCGASVKEEASFCHSCGERVDGIRIEMPKRTKAVGNQKSLVKKVIIGIVFLLIIVIAVKIGSVLGSGGTANPVDLPRSNKQAVQCAPCNGMGQIRCGDCSGTGYRLGEWDPVRGESKRHTCVTCNGSGLKRCTYCDGTGWR